jgi:anti-sigma regulatory factor (Ser/Thr protein kinase)
VQIDERAIDAPAAERGSAAAENAALRVTCRRQAWVIDTMTRVIGNLRGGVSALKAENTELRAELVRLQNPGFGPRGAAASEPSECVEERVPLDAHAAAVARELVARLLAQRVTSPVLERAKLMMSELVTTGVRHGEASGAGHAAIRVAVWDGGIWLEVEHPGGGEVVSQPAEEARPGDGFDPDVVHALDERWGSEHSTTGGTRMWAQLSDTAASSGPDVGERDEPRPARADRAGER